MALTKEDLHEISEMLKVELQPIKTEIQEVKEKVKDLEERTTAIELHLENVTDKNILTLAEGHSDISKRLRESLKAETEKAMLIIKVRMLEDEVRKIKDKLEKIA